MEAAAERILTSAPEHMQLSPSERAAQVRAERMERESRVAQERADERIARDLEEEGARAMAAVWDHPAAHPAERAAHRIFEPEEEERRSQELTRARVMGPDEARTAVYFNAPLRDPRLAAQAAETGA